MSEFQHSIAVNATPDSVFGFLSEVQNMPHYLPTVQDASRQGPDRIRVQGSANGHPYDNEGFFQVDNASRRMEWGSDGENEYRGWLRVVQADRGNTGEDVAAEVTVHLSFEPKPGVAQALQRQTGDRDLSIDQGLQNAMQSIKNLCEGRGNKIEPPQELSQTS